MVVVNRSQVSLIVGDDEDSETTRSITQKVVSESTSESTSSTSTTTESTDTEEIQSTSANASQPSSSDGGVEVGAIVGGVVGGLAVVGLTIGFLGFMCLRRRNHHVNTTSPGPVHYDQQQPYTPEAKSTPFDRFRQLVGGSNPPVELQGDTPSPTTAYTHQRLAVGS